MFRKKREKDSLGGGILRNDTDKDFARQVAEIIKSAYDKLKDILSKAAKENRD